MRVDLFTIQEVLKRKKGMHLFVMDTTQTDYYILISDGVDIKMGITIQMLH
jgi:hypothetical protein